MQARRDGRTGEAKSELEAALELSADMGDDPRRQRTLALAADFYQAHGHSAEANRCYDQLLSVTERSHGTDDPAVARVLAQMGAAYEAQGSLGRAEMLYRRAMRTFETSVGEDHRRTGLVAAALANVLRLQEEWNEALHFYQIAIEIEQNVAAGDATTLLRLYMQLSHVYSELGREAELEEVYLKASELVEKAHGIDPLDEVSVRQRLASFYRHRQRLEEAANQYGMIYEAQRESLGAHHPAAAATLRHLGLIAEGQERLQDATDLYRQAAETIAAGASRTEAMQHAATLCDWARVLHKGGRLEEARAVYTDAVERNRATLTPQHPNLATSITGMALLLEQQGELDRAEMLANEALELCSATGDRTHPNTVQLLDLMARIAERRQDWPLAEALTTALIEAEQKLARPDTLRDVARLRQLSGIEVNLGKFRLALEHCGKAMDLLRYNPAMKERPEMKDLEFERQQMLMLAQAE